MSSKLKPDRSARRLRERDSYPPISDKGYYQNICRGWTLGPGRWCVCYAHSSRKADLLRVPLWSNPVIGGTGGSLAIPGSYLEAAISTA